MLAVEYAQHSVLAEQVRHDRDAQIDLAAVDSDLEAAVLRDTALGDVEFRDHLHARQHLMCGFEAIDTLDDLEHAVDAVLDDQPAALRFQVDVARLGLQRIVDGRVHQPYDRAVGGADIGDRYRQRQRVVLGGGHGAQGRRRPSHASTFLPASGTRAGRRRRPAPRQGHFALCRRSRCVAQARVRASSGSASTSSRRCAASVTATHSRCVAST